MSSFGIKHDATAPTPELRTYSYKLGWIQGVLIPCLLNIWGVMLFLRIAWVVAQAGIGFTLLIIFVSSVVCIITTLSLSAICTNGVVQGGGVYYLVSRSLGAELGASVGIMFAFANAVAASMNTIGFCESLNDLLKKYGAKIVDNGHTDIRIVGTIALLVMCLICAVGMDWETKAQNFLITVIVAAIINYIIGALAGPLSEEQKAKGFFGINMEVGAMNWAPDYRRDSTGVSNNFFSVFAIYFPAVTGVQAGANICGDLRDPAKAIPKGTLLAVFISTSSYIILAVLCGVSALRDASGNVADLSNKSILEACKPNCSYGTHNNFEMMQLISLWDLLIFFGCWAATLSTALTNLLAVPRLIQALGQDQIYPGLIFFSKPYGRHGEPYRGYVLTFMISVIFVLIADLDKIAPVITNFYLASYALINFCTFHAGLIDHFSWRPQFQYYNKWLSLLGFVMCLVIMMIIEWIMALVTVLLFLTLYLLVLYIKPTVNWGSSTDAQQYQNTVSYLLNLRSEKAAIKSYNPQLLVMTGRPYLKTGLLHIGHLITKIGSFMIVADIVNEQLIPEEREMRIQTGTNWLKYMKYRAFYVLLEGHDMENGVGALLQTTGLGRMSPNVLLMGYKDEWYTKPYDVIRAYVGTLQKAFELNAALTILRTTDTESALRLKSTTSSESDDEKRHMIHSQVQTVLSADSEEFLIESQSEDQNNTEIRNLGLTKNAIQTKLSRKEGSDSEHQHGDPLILNDKSNIDAWWLFDDGGLNILLPYIISRRGLRTKMPFRIFVLAKGTHKDEKEADKQIQALLKKFRIECESLLRIRGLTNEPTEATWDLFNKIIAPFKTEDSSDTLITNEELRRLHPKTLRYLRLRELILENSSETSLIILTLPLPRKGLVSSALYMAWLEVLSQNMPPILFVRGNTSAVIAT